MFQFFAGDLYEVIPRVAYNFLASDVITGKCTAEPTTLKIEKGTHETINVTMDYDCNLYAAGKQVAVFKIQNMTFQVEGKVKDDHLNFHVVGFSRKIQFFEYDQYKVENLELAELMVNHSLNRLVE